MAYIIYKYYLTFSYMITQNISTKIGVMTLMYFICFVLIKPAISGNLLDKNQIIILPLLFFLWLSSSFFIPEKTLWSSSRWKKIPDP